MALSKHEQKLLEEMEKNFYKEDPKFVRTIQNSNLSSRTSLTNSLLLFAVIVGAVILVWGTAQQNTLLGVAGFIISLIATATFFIAPKNQKKMTTTHTGQEKSPSQPKQRMTFMEKLEQRWRRRQDGRGT